MKGTFIIAEAGVNHNGNLDMALQLIDLAKLAGADAVKFQTFKSSHVISRHAKKAEYQKKNTDKDESQLEMVKQLELSFQNHNKIVEHCLKVGIEFMSTPFDLESTSFLTEEMKLKRLKVASGELLNYQTLIKLARTKLPLLLSTGMCTTGEIEEALGVIAYAGIDSSQNPHRLAFKEAYNSDAGQEVIRRQVTLLHCTTEYPAPFSELNLKAINTLKRTFGVDVGFSDHSEGIIAPVAAVAMGATVIEKHFTLDKSLPGPDHKASLSPNELVEMVRSVRDIESAIGDGIKRPKITELRNIPIARKSLVAAAPIERGDRFTEQNLTVKRPGTGISSTNFYDYLGRMATRNYQPDDLIEE